MCHINLFHDRRSLVSWRRFFSLKDFRSPKLTGLLTILNSELVKLFKICFQLQVLKLHSKGNKGERILQVEGQSCKISAFVLVDYEKTPSTPCSTTKSSVEIWSARIPHWQAARRGCLSSVYGKIGYLLNFGFSRDWKILPRSGEVRGLAEDNIQCFGRNYCHHL